jgi:hypothetical protein
MRMIPVFSCLLILASAMSFAAWVQKRCALMNTGRPCGTCQVARFAALIRWPPLRHLSGAHPFGTCRVAALTALVRWRPLPCDACQVAALAAFVRWPALAALVRWPPLRHCQVGAIAAIVRWPPLRLLSGGHPCGACQVAALAALVKWRPLRRLSGGRPRGACQGAALAEPVRELGDADLKMADICTQRTAITRISHSMQGHYSRVLQRSFCAADVWCSSSYQYIVFCVIHGSKLR